MSHAQAGPGNHWSIGAAIGALAGFLARDLDLTTLVSYWGDPVPLLLLWAALGALTWRSRLRMLPVTLTLLLTAAWLAVATTPVVHWIGDGLIRADPLPERADAVFVLASVMQDDGEPTTIALVRLLHGIELLAEGRAARLILSELPEPWAPYAPWARGQMARLGIDAEVLSVGPVRRTRDEAIAVAQLCRERGWSRLVVVTSPTHTRRAAAAFEMEGLTVHASPSLETRFDWETLARRDQRFAAFGVVLHERVGLWYYARRGWIAP